MVLECPDGVGSHIRECEFDGPCCSRVDGDVCDGYGGCRHLLKGVSCVGLDEGLIVSDVDVEVVIFPVVGPPVGSYEVVSDEYVVVAFDDDEWNILEHVSCFQFEVEVCHLVCLAEFVGDESFDCKVAIFDVDWSMLLNLLEESWMNCAACGSVVVECHGCDSVKEIDVKVVPIVS